MKFLFSVQLLSFFFKISGHIIKWTSYQKQNKNQKLPHLAFQASAADTKLLTKWEQGSLSSKEWEGVWRALACAQLCCGQLNNQPGAISSSLATSAPETSVVVEDKKRWCR